MYQYLLFDLDGTLTDSAPGIIASVNYALQKMGRTVPSGTDMGVFIGPPLLDSFQAVCGMTKADAEQAVAFYRERYNDTGKFESSVYPGIPELLDRLRADGKTLAVATAKPEFFSFQILEHFDLARRFDFIAGASLDESRAHKNQVIAWCLQNLPGADSSNTVMLGDRDQDILGALENRIDCIGLLYGYGSKEELSGAGASVFARDTEELYQLLTR